MPDPPPISDMRNVFSSHVDKIHYDEDQMALTVVFSNGSHGFYDGVPPDVARGVLTAPSIGEELHRSVRGQYPFAYHERVKGKQRGP